ncbi:MAG: HEAT repeat domain-containing protein [Nitrospirota bacterium]
MMDATATYTLERLAREDPARRREALEALAERGRHDDVEILVACLRDSNPGVQEAAMSALARIGGDLVVRRLVALLREPPAIRNMAVEVLRQIVSGALDSALPILRSPDPNIRKFMVDILGRQTDSRVVPPLIELLSDPDANVRAATAEALGRLRAAEAVSGIVSLLSDEEWVVFAAITALAEIGEPAALPPLIDVLEKGSEAVQCAAVDAIAHLDREGVSLPVLMRLIESSNPELHAVLIKTLVAITDRVEADIWSTLDPTRCLPILRELLRRPDPELRTAAIVALGRLGDKRATRLILNACRRWEYAGEEVIARAIAALTSLGDAPQLIQAMRPDEDDMTIGTILIRTLGQMRCTDAVPALAAVRLGSPNWELRKLALHSLALIGTDEAMHVIQHAIGDPAGYVRCEAVRLLAQSGRATDIKSLLDQLKAERYEDVREAIVDALAAVATAEVGIEAVALLDSTCPKVRRAGAQLIGRMRLPEGLQPLLEALNDPDWSVRQAIAEALGCFDDRRAADALLVGLSDEDERVRLAAVMALSQTDRPECRAALIGQGLRDPDIWVRYRSIERLGRGRAAEAVPALTIIARDSREPEMLRRAAAEALAAIDRRETRK